MEMTDNEIKQALNECSTEPCGIQAFIYATRNALDLINHQQAEIERLNRVCEEVSTTCGECHEGYAKKIKEAQAEAIKEFAERLKEKAEYHENGEGWEGDIYYADDVDNLVKEMVGDSE